MSGNRFDFLEIGEGAPAPPPDASYEPDLATPADAPAPRGLDGTPLAQVRITDPRGYRSFLEQAQDPEAVASPGALRRHATRSPHGALRVAEVFGERGSQAGQFNFPTGLAVDARGILFVADSYNHRVQRITPGGGVAVIGARGSRAGQFLSPQGVAVDEAQSFYIVEQGNHRVQKYSADGVLLLMFGRQGQREGELQGPTGVAVAPGTGDIFVADTGNCRVQRFNAEGRFLGLIGAPGGLHAPLAGPQALLVDEGDNLFVADTFAHRVVRYDPLGRFAGQYGGRFGQAGVTPRNLFHEPRALAFDPAGWLYVADGGAPNALPARESHGRLLAFELASEQIRASVEALGRGVVRPDGSPDPRPLVRPSGLALSPPVGAVPAGPDRRGDVYLADTMNHRILRFAWN